jgi:hypothetical protein
MRYHETRLTDMKLESVDCEFCGRRICEFFDDVDASLMIRSAAVGHFANYCTFRPPDFSGGVLRVYFDILVQAYRMRRELRQRRARAGQPALRCVSG